MHGLIELKLALGTVEGIYIYISLLYFCELHYFVNSLCDLIVVIEQVNVT